MTGLSLLKLILRHCHVLHNNSTATNFSPVQKNLASTQLFEKEFFWIVGFFVQLIIYILQWKFVSRIVHFPGSMDICCHFLEWDKYLNCGYGDKSLCFFWHESCFLLVHDVRWFSLSLMDETDLFIIYELVHRAHYILFLHVCVWFIAIVVRSAYDLL